MTEYKFTDRLLQLSFLCLIYLLALIYIIGIKENWKIYQGAEVVYENDNWDFPHWMVFYVDLGYSFVTAMCVFLQGGLTFILMKRLDVVSLKQRWVYVLLISSLWSILFFGLGVLCANNIVNIVEGDPVHGTSHIR